MRLNEFEDLPAIIQVRATAILVPMIKNGGERVSFDAFKTVLRSTPDLHNVDLPDVMIMDQLKLLDFVSKIDVIDGKRMIVFTGSLPVDGEETSPEEDFDEKTEHLASKSLKDK